MHRRWVMVIGLVSACGDDGATTPDAHGMSCQVDADCGAQFCTANRCDARPSWNEPIRLGGDVYLATANQVGIAVRADNLEIVYATNRNGTTASADLWHASRQSPTADFAAPTVLAAVSDPNNIDKMPTMRGDGLELYFVRASLTGLGAIWRATRASTADDFAAPEMTSVFADMNCGGQTLSPDGLTLMYLILAQQQPRASAVYATTRATASDAFAAGTEVTDLGLVGTGIARSPDGRYVVTIDPTSYQLQVHLRSAAGTYETPVPITEHQSSAVTAMPTIAPDGKTLYFSRQNSMNNNELWAATRK